MSVMNQRLSIKYHEGCVYIMHHGNAKKYHGPPSPDTMPAQRVGESICGGSKRGYCTDNSRVTGICRGKCNKTSGVKREQYRRVFS